MVVQLETLSQGPFGKYGPSHYRDIPSDSDEEGKGFGADFFQRQTISDLKDGLSSKCSNHRSPHLHGSCKYAHEPVVAVMPTPLVKPPSNNSGSSPPTTPRSGESLASTESPTSPSTFSFKQLSPVANESFSFPSRQPGALRNTFKRRRPVTDVDGPNTASLGCKKRRLRRRLITSKLSQPFSLPATHVINREAAAMGDKRFLKLAALSAARRLHGATAPNPQHHHASPSSLLLRAAVINRFRLRVRNEAVERGDIKVADIAANAALLQQSHGLGLVVGARFPATSPATPVGLAIHAQRGPQQNLPRVLPSAAVEARLLSPGISPVRPIGCGPAGLRLPPSPRLRPIRSPELRTTRPPSDVEEEYEMDDGEVAFPNSEHDSRYDSSDEPDDVYADFELIFGGGAGDAESSDEEGEHYEDVMDELDGIPWRAR
ncbi:hypothetical protein QBC33DRAFT_200035 [Phialemonium atrogriseum]|uniref:Uncharacterized protein n=1 Tax=Phialemonium atrogriseum TaxID=1093897 RepID=A0AAJ0BWL2_9PEZI|nr:uncharacterized protein QBC33DRAFT_200035 [Phialemonium atrogriseum]KAK1764449.1 hypothetical protein QBC33DRAFT_200035 [Phialemonium atrogriseum]